MKLLFVLSWSLFVLYALSVCSIAQETVISKDGRRINLNPNGTWEYVTNSPASSTSALETLRAYLSAKTWRERVPYVLNSETVKSLMEARYADNPWKIPEFEFLTQNEPQPDNKGWVKIQVYLDGRSADYYMKNTKDGYKIDWETSAGYNLVSPEEFRATLPTSPVRFSAYATLGDFYNYEFSDSQIDTWSMNLVESSGKEIGYGYARKSTPMGQKLFQLLKDGKKHRIVVQLQYLPKAQSSYHFLISEVINFDGWWYEKKETAVQPTNVPVRR